MDLTRKVKFMSSMIFCELLMICSLFSFEKEVNYDLIGEVLDKNYKIKCAPIVFALFIFALLAPSSCHHL